MPPEDELLFDGERQQQQQIMMLNADNNDDDDVHNLPGDEVAGETSDTIDDTNKDQEDQKNIKEEYERMLDYFPLDYEELIFVLDGYSKYQNQNQCSLKNEDITSLSPMFHSNILLGMPNKQERKRKRITTTMIMMLLKRMITTNNDDYSHDSMITPDEFLKRRQHVEKEFLQDKMTT